MVGKIIIRALISVNTNHFFYCIERRNYTEECES